MQTRLSDHNAIKVIIFALEPLAKAIPTERAEHATVYMWLDQAGRFMTPQNPYRENIRSVKDLQRNIGAEVTYHFSAGPFFPFLGIIMSFLYPIFEFLTQFLVSSFSR